MPVCIQSGKLVEGEAEEEEEVGRQAGLGDYFFGVPKSAEDDEREALKLRAGDLEHIVDDVSDGEGDEVLGRSQRMEEEARLDRLKTKKILEALATGHQSARQKQSAAGQRGHYGLDELAAEGITGAGDGAAVDDEDAEQDFDFDDDEELQASYLNKMTSRVRRQKEEAGVDELTDDDDDSDEEASGDREYRQYISIRVHGNCFFVFIAQGLNGLTTSGERERNGKLLKRRHTSASTNRHGAIKF